MNEMQELTNKMKELTDEINALSMSVGLKLLIADDGMEILDVMHNRFCLYALAVVSEMTDYRDFLKTLKAQLLGLFVFAKITRFIMGVKS